MFDFQWMINLMNENSKLSKRWEALSPLDILTKLKDSKAKIVKFWDWTNPWKFLSYRWSYCELSLNTQEEEKTLQEFIKQLEEIDWKVLEWYKGGDFTMSNKDIIHIAERGHTSNNYILDVLENWDTAILVLIEKELD